MSIYSYKEPKDEDKHVGIEIEFLSFLGRDQVASILNKSKNKRLYYLHGDASVREEQPRKTKQKCKFCSHKNDFHRDTCVFCNNFLVREPGVTRIGHELCVLTKEKDLMGCMKILGEDLKKIKAEVNKTCGLHVHLDMRRRNQYDCFSSLVKAQSLLFSLVSKNRRKNNYCTKTKDDFEDSGHYNAINGSGAFSEHRTIEVRLHHGTTDIFEMYNWVKLLLNIINRRTPGKRVSQYIKKQKEKMKAA